MLTVKWKNSAQIDLAEIVGYIEQYNQAAAVKIRLLIETTAESLAEMPYKFPRGRVPNTREVVVGANAENGKNCTLS